MSEHSVCGLLVQIRVWQGDFSLSVLKANLMMVNPNRHVLSSLLEASVMCSSCKDEDYCVSVKVTVLG